MEQQQITEVRQTLKQRLIDAGQKCNDRWLNSDEAEIIFGKLKKHYKLRNYYIQFTDRLTRHSGYCWSYGKIQVRWRTRLETLCHEITHAIDFSKGRRKKYAKMHTKRFERLVNRVCLYCVNHNFWQDEIAKRTAPKPVKPEPTKDEIRLEKIEKKRLALARYEKKLKYCTKLYSNKIKSTKRSLMMLEKSIIRTPKDIVDITTDDKVDITPIATTS